MPQAQVHRILTHPGSAHKDDFLACSLLVHLHGVPVVRREPTQEDLDDLATCVVDVGGEHDPERNNFDHHQFPADHPPVCALSLVLQHLGLYEDARAFCEWLEPAEWFDCLGPNTTAKKLGVERDIVGKLNSPMDMTLLRRFAGSQELNETSPIWQLMRMVGEDLVTYLQSLRERLTFIGEYAEFWPLPLQSEDGQTLEALFMPRTEPMPEEASFGLGRFIEEQGREATTVAMVYPDRRGTGYGLSRYNDNARMDFTQISSCDDVHFAHARGFVAKTAAAEPQRLKELLGLAIK